MGIKVSPERNSEKRIKIVAKLQILFKLIVSFCTSNGVIKCAKDYGRQVYRTEGSRNGEEGGRNNVPSSVQCCLSTQGVHLVRIEAILVFPAHKVIWNRSHG